MLHVVPLAGSPHVLLPASAQDGLHLLGLLIDPLIPGEAGLLTERGHRGDQLIHLCTQEGLPIARLNRFHLRRARRTEPILNRDGVGRPMDGNPEIIHLAA